MSALRYPVGNLGNYNVVSQNLPASILEGFLGSPRVLSHSAPARLRSASAIPRFAGNAVCALSSWLSDILESILKSEKRFRQSG